MQTDRQGIPTSNTFSDEEVIDQEAPEENTTDQKWDQKDSLSHLHLVRITKGWTTTNQPKDPTIHIIAHIASPTIRSME